MEASSISEVRTSAEELFYSGLFCAESVLLALAKAQGIDSDLLPKIAKVSAAAWLTPAVPAVRFTGAVKQVRRTG